MGSSIGERRHRVAICSQSDVILKDGQYVYSRPGVIEGWAAITPVAFNRFSRDGAAITDDSKRPTHTIEMNYNPNVNVSVSAWIFERRLKSPPRWFQIISVENCYEESQFWKFKVRLAEASDDVSEPAKETPRSDFDPVPLPDGVEL